MKLLINNYRAPSWNQLYSASHWIKRKKMADEIHELVLAAYYENTMRKPRFLNKVNITITAHFTNRLLDSDNIMAKLWIDGLKGYVITDDSPEFVESVTTKSVKDTKNFVEIEII